MNERENVSVEERSRPWFTFQFYYDLCCPPQLEVLPGVFLDSRTNDASMRNVWATIGFSNCETRGGPFGMLPEGS